VLERTSKQHRGDDPFSQRSRTGAPAISPSSVSATRKVAWLLGIIVNLLLVPGYYDVALRDLGLALAALALARLSPAFSAPQPRA
jgi:hypothetical protein